MRNDRPSRLSAYCGRGFRRLTDLGRGVHVRGRIRLVAVPASTAAFAPPTPPPPEPAVSPALKVRTLTAPLHDPRGRAVSVVVPVYNALDDVRRCLESVVRNTSSEAQLVVIDDCSTDPAIAPFLADFAQRHSHVEILTNKENLGFVKTANRGFASRPDDDIVLLNSDTEVPPRWLQAFSLAAADPTVATVTALSNNAGAFSAPEIGVDNPLPADIDRVGRAVSQHAERTSPEVHTGHGFCMLFKREVLDQLGGFDEERFGRGYCEENDFSMRARASGWRNVVADGLLVAHHGSASFGDDKGGLLAENRSTLDELHPEYNDLVPELLASESLAAARSRVAEAFSTAPRTRPRVLYVLHTGGGGTPQTNQDLMQGVANDFDPLLLRSDGAELTLTNGVSGAELLRLPLPTHITTTTHSDPDYAAIVRSLLIEFAVELVHIRHLQRHPFDLAYEARRLDIPVIVSLHDYYFVCPSVQLIDDHDRWCAGVCSEGQGTCRTPPGLADTPHLKHGYVHEWRRHTNALLSFADALVTTNETGAEVFTSAFPEIAARLRVIPHGRDLDQRESLAVAPQPGEPVRILVPGTMGIHKGAGLIEAIAHLDVDERLEFHLIGSMTREASVPRLVDHGPYERDDFARLVEEIRPVATAVLSIWGETYSHTVTESWSVGVPVLGSYLGAVGARLATHGGGWRIDVSDPEVAYRQIIDALDDPEGWREARRGATVRGLPSVRDMSESYLELYEEVLARRRVMEAP